MHPGASRTGRVKDGEAAPAPTITATKKRGIQTRILPHSDHRKARRTHRAQTRDTNLERDNSSEDQGATSPNGLAHHDTSTGVIGQDQVTSQSALNALVALVLFGDAPKWSGQGKFEDTSGTHPGRVQDMSGRGHIFRQFWARTWDKFEK